MSTSTTIRSIYISFIAAGILFLTHASHARPQSGIRPTVPSNGQMPDKVFYAHIFRHVLFIQDHDVLTGSRNLQSPLITGFYTSRIGTTPHENELLIRIARAWQAEVAPVDLQAQTLIKNIHAHTPGGKLATGEQPPAIPQALLDLQQKHDSITENKIALLHQLLGDPRFAQIDHNLRKATRVMFNGASPISHKNLRLN